VVEVKEKEPNPYSESDSENNWIRQIINAYPTSTITTTTIQPEKSTYPEEGKCLFHS
jgi:hypothetical protein